jgi:hypothetical protein
VRGAAGIPLVDATGCNRVRIGRRASSAHRPKIKQPLPQSFTATPHGKLPTATDLVTLSFSTSMTEMSFETPFVV